MAKYWEDWSGSTIGQDPTGWTKRWVTTGYTSVVEEDAATPGGRRLRLNRPSTEGRSLLSMDAVDSDADRATCRIRAFLKTETWGNTLVVHGSVVGRGAGTSSGSATAYTSSMYQASGSATGRIALNRYSSGNFTTLHQSSSDVISANTYYWVGLDCVGDQITYSVRDASDPETVVYTHTFTDATISAAGHIGVFLFSFLSGNIDVGAVAIATGADEAFYTDPGAGDVPQGVVTISDVTPGITTADVTYSYNDTDQDSFEYRINSGTAASIGASVATISGLTADTTYNSPGIQVRAINATGAGEWSTAVAFTTEAEAVVVKGISVIVHDRATQQPRINETGLKYRYWDAATGTGAPLFEGADGSTHASTGAFTLNIDATTTLDLTDLGYLSLIKTGATKDDDIVFSGRVPVSDIS